MSSFSSVYSNNSIPSNSITRLVKCAATGASVLDKECTMMPDGAWIQTDILIRSFDPLAIPAEEPKVVEMAPMVEDSISEEELQFESDDF